MELEDMKFKLRRSDDKKELYGMVAIWLLGLVVLLALNLYFCMSAKAGAFGEVGVSVFKKPPDRLWWQSEYSNSFDNESLYFRVGYEHGPFRVSAFNLGKYKLTALATSDEARLVSGQCNESTCAPPELFVTRGSVRGVLLSGVYRHGKFFFETGLSINKQTFDLSVDLINDGSLNGPKGKSYHYKEARTGRGYMLSAGYENKHVTYSVAYWNTGNTSLFDMGGFPSGVSDILSISVGYMF